MVGSDELLEAHIEAPASLHLPNVISNHKGMAVRAGDQLVWARTRYADLRASGAGHQPLLEGTAGIDF